MLHNRYTFDREVIGYMGQIDNRIGKRIRELRMKEGYTLRELGERLNFDYSYLSRVENGRKIPSIELLQQMADFFGVDISYFFMKDEELELFEEDEKELLFDKELDLEELKERFNLTVDGVPATDEEIEEAIKYIKALRIMKKTPSI
jgi:transcriptional regulator with XRE-family HTH domain